MSKEGAISILKMAGVQPGSDFHSLTATQVMALLAEADMRRYRKPGNANGSRARCFYAYPERRAARCLPT